MKPLGTQGDYLNLPPFKELWEDSTVTDMYGLSFNYHGCYFNVCFVLSTGNLGKLK